MDLHRAVHTAPDIKPHPQSAVLPDKTDVICQQIHIRSFVAFSRRRIRPVFHRKCPQLTGMAFQHFSPVLIVHIHNPRPALAEQKTLAFKIFFK